MNRPKHDPESPRTKFVWPWSEMKTMVFKARGRVQRATGVKLSMLAEIAMGNMMPTPRWRLAHHAIDVAGIWMEHLETMARPRRAPSPERRKRVWDLLCAITRTLDLALKTLREDLP